MPTKNKQLRWGYGSKEYAEARSQDDAKISNENARATAQAAILINGGAATAVLALLSKDKLDPFILRTVPLCLLGYAGGVLCGAYMTFCMGHALREWGISWRLYSVNPADTDAIDDAAARANRWNRKGRRAFYTAMACFILASAGLAFLLFLYSSTPGFRPKIKLQAARMYFSVA